MSESQMEIKPGQRTEEDLRMARAFLTGESLPLSTSLKKGFKSILTDPWLTWIRYLSGPLGMILRQRYYRKRLGFMGQGVVFDPEVMIDNPENVYLDDYSYLGRQLRLVSPEGYIKIGKRCHVAGWILGHGCVEIGNAVASGAYIFSGTDSHKGGFRMSGPMVLPEQRRVRKGKIVVGDDAFLGHFSIIMPGARIGEGAIVAPHSVVIGRVKPWTVVAGNPAVKISEREPVKFPKID